LKYPIPVKEEVKTKRKPDLTLKELKALEKPTLK